MADIPRMERTAWSAWTARPRRNRGCNIAGYATGLNRSTRWGSCAGSTVLTGMWRWAPSLTCSRKRAAAPAILFDRVPGYAKGFRTLYGQLSSVRRIALTLGLPPEYERRVDVVG